MTHRASCAAYAALFDTMYYGEFTIPELIEASGMCESTVRKFILAMRHRNMLHVVAYDNDNQGRLTRKVYKLGAGKDVPRPPPRRTKKQIFAINNIRQSGNMFAQLIKTG